VKTLHEKAQTETDMQIEIEDRLCNASDGGAERTILVIGYPSAHVPAPTNGY
jgi:hypothetical protein